MLLKKQKPIARNRTAPHPLQEESENSLLGRGSTSGDGPPEEITLGAGITLTGRILSATGTGGTVTNVTASGIITSSGGATPNIDTSLATNSLAGNPTGITGSAVSLSMGSGLLADSVANTIDINKGWVIAMATAL